MNPTRSTQLGARSGLVPLAVMAVAGCSFLVPLDYVGGTAGSSQSGGGSGRSGGGGSSGADAGGVSGGGASAAGGTSSGDGGAPDAGAGNEGGVPGAGGAGGSEPNAGGGQGGTAGSSGGDAGMAGEGTSGEDGSGGTAGMTGGAGAGGTGGRGGVGGRGGMAGASAGMGGGAACPLFDLQTDHDHCGSCDNACAPAAVCLAGQCVASPCDKLCTTFTSVPLSSEGYRRDDIQSADVCYEVTGYAPALPKLPRIVCWEFANGRTMQVNGVNVSCPAADPGTPLLMPQRLGGYCVHAGPGDHPYAGFKLPLPSQ